MKRVLSWIALAAVTMSGLFFSSAALAQEAAIRQTPSIDAVILLDNSNSMSGASSTVKNDAEGYRFDATEMFVTMCDLNGSRVAVIPFAGNILGGDDAFVDISSRAARDAKIQEIEAMWNKNDTQPHTDYGTALCKAVKMILDRKETDNKPVIILLTDGQLEVPTTNSKNTSKTIYQWNDPAKTFKAVEALTYDNAAAAEQANLAIDKAQEYDIPVYTIALLEDLSVYAGDTTKKEKEQLAFEDTLKGYANRTNGEFNSINAKNVNELPKIFGDIFAKQINSSLLSELTPVKTGENQYEVVIPILNQSVQEANIFIPKQELDSVKLIDATGKEIGASSRDVFKFDCKAFQLFKIFSPQSIGEWKLIFSLKNDSSQIAFSLLYNYNLMLKSRISAGTFNDRTFMSGDQGITFSKGDLLNLESRFYNLDGTPSADLDLYNVYDASVDTFKNWWTITGSYTLYPAGFDTPVFPVRPMTNELNSFSGNIDLRSAKTDAAGYNALSSGDYTLEVEVQGAGLHHTETIPLTLTNSDPVVADPSGVISRVILVDDPKDAASQEVQTSIISLGDEVTDPDHDRLIFDLVPADSNAENIVRLTLNADNTLTLQTVKDPDTGMFKFGTANYTLIVEDVDPYASKHKFPIVIDVRSVANQMISGLHCDTLVQGWDEATRIVQKNTAMTFTMKLTRDAAAATAMDPHTEIRYFSGTLNILNTDTGRLIDSIPMTPDYNNDTLSAQYTTSDRSGSFTAVCTYIYDRYSQQPITQPFDFTIVNHAPTVNAQAAEDVPKTILFAPLPGFLSFIEQPTEAEDLTIDLQELFEDQDHETLAYSAPELTNENPVDITRRLEATTNGNTVTLVPLTGGTVILSVTATDGDGETATFEKVLKTVNLTEKWTGLGLLALGVLLALIALILIVRQIRKPYFSRSSVLMFMEGQCLFEAARHALDHTKKEQKLSRYLDMELAARNRISMEFVDSILIKPSRGSSGGVQVRYAGHSGSYRLSLEDFTIGKKYADWRPDQELILSSTSSNDMIRVMLTRESQDSVPFPSTGFDDFTSSSPDMFNDGFGGDADEFNQKPNSRSNSDF